MCQGACVAGWACGRGTCVAGGVHGWGHVWQGGVHGRGHAWHWVCMAGETTTAADGTHPTAIHSCFC